MRILVEYCQGDYTATLMDDMGMLCSSRALTREVAIKRVKKKALERGDTDSSTKFVEVDMTESEET